MTSHIYIKPWGTYQTLEINNKFHTKEIIVHQRQRLSLQSHNFRSEHWIIVEGKCKVTLDNDTIELNNNQHVFIPKQCKHRIENIGEGNLILVEVQTGTYFGEDDITRYEDDYNRSS